MLKTSDSSVAESSIEIKYTGLQKGEKIHEELFIGDNITSTEHSMILQAREELFAFSDIEKMLVDLQAALDLDDDELRKKLMGYVQ